MGFIVGVAGATGALGGEVLRALEHVPWPIDTLVPLARASTSTPFVRFQDREIPVDDIALEDLERFDLLILALPAEAAVEWGERAIHAGVRVVDTSGALHGPAVPMGVPWINPEALQEAPRGAYALPTPEALLAASILGPLQRAGIEGATEASFFLPASRFGRAGLEELSAQVIALFNAGTPPRAVFRDGLAFDLLPSGGLPTGSGWTTLEQRIANELHILLALAPPPVLTVGVPVFSGLSAELRIEPTRRPMPELVAKVLADAKIGLPRQHGPRDLPRPRRVEGMPFPSAGRIRVDEQGEVLRIWSSMDNLRASATAVAGLAGLLLRDVEPAEG